MATATKVTFYELNEQRQVLDAFLAETEGDETPEIAELWEKLAGDATMKATSWAKWTKELALQGDQIEAMQRVLRAQVERLGAERKAIEARVERSRAELSRQMRLFGLESAKVPGVSIWHVEENPFIDVPAVETLSEEQYASAIDLGILVYTPEHTTTVPATREWSTAALVAVAETFVDGEDLGGILPPGVRITFRKGIRIK